MTGENIRIDQTGWWKLTTAYLGELAVMEDSRLPKGLIRKLQWLAESIPSDKFIRCALAHGDFTPWNMYVAHGGIHLYDWELSIPDAPAMLDACHFVFQSGILIHRRPAAAILQEVAALQEYDLVRDDFHLYLRLYLLINCAYYLQLYSRQAQWHVQIGWLLQTWSEALDMVLEEDGIASQRQLLCMDVFDHLQNKPYAALKWLEERPEDVPVGSDIDLCVDRRIVGGLGQLVRKHPLVEGCRIRRKSFMNNYAIFLKDGSLLSIDAIWAFMRKDVRMLDAAALLGSRQTDKYGVQIPEMEMDCRYAFLFYLLNGASVPERYQTRFGRSELAFAFDYNQNVHEAILKRIRSQPANMGWRGMLKKLHYWRDVAGDLFHRGGMVVTFSGVDGAGKSTIIENTRQLLEKQLRRKVIVLRHRPSLLPILSAWTHGKELAEKKAAGTLPRQGRNKSSLSSLLRFVYYYVDYWFGQFYVQFRYVNRGYVVLYDRYYFDFINDSQRSNIRLSPSFTGWFYRFLLKPDLNFFLYALPEEILQRKQELDMGTIQELTDKYMRLFKRLTRRYRYSKYIPINNRHMADTIATIFEHIKISA
jgi:thymidylate kinase